MEKVKNISILSSVLLTLLFTSCLSPESEEKTDNSAAANANIYYIDPQGNDSNDGKSTATPWKTIDKVNTMTFIAGDKILFKSDGVWAGNLAPKGSGNSSSSIIIDKYGAGTKPLINGAGTVNNSATLYLDNQSYWEINNLEITHTSSLGNLALSGIKVNSSDTMASSNITISNCYVHNVNSTPDKTPNFVKTTGGIIFNGLINNVLVKNCHVKDCAIEGIRTSSKKQADNIVFEYNLIENVYGDGIVFNGVKNSKILHNVLRNVSKSDAANYAGCWTYNSTGTRIAFNEVTGIKGGGPNDGQSFDADIKTNGDIFEYNYSHDNDRGFMLFMPDAQNIVVRYNISVNDVKHSNSGSSGSKLFNYTSNYSSNKIYNNTFYTNYNFSTIFLYTNTGNNFAFNGTFNNNIIYSTGSVKRFSDRPITEKAIFKSNCFYPESLTAVNGPSGNASENKYVDPIFVSPSANGTPIDFKLKSNSPLISGSINMPNNGGVDYFQTPLPTNPDVGFAQSK